MVTYVVLHRRWFKIGVGKIWVGIDELLVGVRRFHGDKIDACGGFCVRRDVSEMCGDDVARVDAKKLAVSHVGREGKVGEKIGA